MGPQARHLADEASTQTSWSAVVALPHPGLRQHLSRPYVDFVETATRNGSRLEPPSGTVTVILNLGDPFAGLPSAFVAGMDDRSTLQPDCGPIACLDLKLTPPGAYNLFGPMDELAGQVIDLEALWGSSSVRRLLDELHHATGPTDRFELLDRFLLPRAEAGARPSPGVLRAWRRIEETGGQVAMGQLAGEIGWSRRHLIARFRREVGLSPKRLARIVRFSHVQDALRSANGRPLVEVAYRCGYADQAHLNRDFRELAGTTPTEFLRRREVKSFQDTLASDH